MRRFTITEGGVPRFIRALVCGPPSSGKTSFAATMPKPLIIGDSVEGGYKVLYKQDPLLRWDPACKPDVWEIESIKDVGPALGDLEKAALGGQFPYKTVVFDALSVYTDRVLFELGEAGRGSDGKQMDGRQLYGDLGTHLQALIRRLHALPAHILWCSHVRPGVDDGTLAIGGQMADKFPALCDFKWYTNVSTVVPNRPVVHELRTKPFRRWTFLGSRFGELPDPLVPSFKVVAHHLGLPEKPVSLDIPGWRPGAQVAPNGAAAPAYASK